MKIKIMLILLLAWALPAVSKTLTVDDFMAEPEFYDLEISPNGKYLAEVAQVNDLRLVTIRDLEKEGRPVIGQLGDSVIRPYAVTWANDERLIVHLLVPYDTNSVRRKMEKEDDYDLNENFMFSRSVSVDLNGKNVVSLLSQTRTLRMQVNLSKIRHILPKDPKHILMSADKSDKESLFKVNIYDGTAELVAQGSRNTLYFLCDLDGNPKYRVDYRRFSKNIEIYEFRKDSDWELVDTLNFDQESDKAIDTDGLVGLSLDGRLVYRKQNEKTGYYELLERDRKSGNSKVLVSLPDRDVLGLISRNDEVIGYQIENDIIIDKYFDKDAQAQYDKIQAKMGGYAFNIYSRDRYGKKFVLLTFGPDFPGGYLLFDNQTNKLEQYADRYSKLPPEHLATPAKAFFATRDGVKERLYILLPPGYEQGKQYPLVVMPHGGPQSRDYAYYDDFAQFVATRGYIVAQPNFRGSTGYGRAFEEAGYKQWGGIMQDDLQDAANFLIKKGFADPQKICLVGASYGGYAALMGLVKHGDFYKCAISINGVTDLVKQIKFDEKRFKDSEKIVQEVYKTIGHPVNDKQNLEANSPLLQAEKINDPVMIITGVKDEVVPFRQSRDFAKKLESLKKSVVYHKYKDAPHNIFYYRDDMKDVYTKVDEFLAKHLQSK